MQKLEDSLKETLDAYVAQARDNNFDKNKAWTYHLKESLAKLGESFEYSVCTSGFKGIYQSEWLYDLVWYKEEGTYPDIRLVDVPLVVEMEWSTNFDHLRYDFEKLLVANARMRLFVCNIYPDDLKRYKLYFRDAVQKYELSRSGDRYLIAMLVGIKHKFDFVSIITP